MQDCVINFSNLHFDLSEHARPYRALHLQYNVIWYFIFNSKIISILYKTVVLDLP